MNEPIFNFTNEAKNLSATLLESRKVLIFGEVDENASCEAIAKLMYLAEVSKKPIKLYINTSDSVQLRCHISPTELLKPTVQL